MKRVLVAYEKHGIRVFDISSEELKNKAYLHLFKERDVGQRRLGLKSGIVVYPDYYSDLREMQSRLYELAKGGDAKAAERILRARTDYEDERVVEMDVE